MPTENKPAAPVTAAEELDAVLHWRGKHTQAIRERDALQLPLNAADQRIDVLEGILREALEWQRKYAVCLNWQKSAHAVLNTPQ